MATQRGDNDMLELLLRQGATIDLADANGNTPLISAACNGRVKTADLLLRKGALTNLQNRAGWTALYAACNFVKPEVVELLLQHEARTDVRDAAGKTAMDVARVTQSWYNDSMLQAQRKCVDLLTQHEHFLRVGRPLRAVCISLCVSRDNIALPRLAPHLREEVQTMRKTWTAAPAPIAPQGDLQ
eukprot:TRINITY_DN6743_c0_g1_i1.p1 TRINITY_DN6743_c0_g1~~TRINITY_DN6743_c0_g1_i1.p1  ORF type:complete len:185 (-),score=36.00 TRINITY_DN6743_c0_g1_i1:87-641(-)